MFVDLLNSYNYIMVNMDAIRVFGLNNAVYTAELLNIYKKAKMKDKLIDGEYFKIDRKFITSRTSLSLEEQLTCDSKLKELNILTENNNEAGAVKFDVELYASLIASEDVKIVDKVIENVKIESKSASKQRSVEYTIRSLKEKVVCSNIELLTSIRDWIDSIFESGKGLSNKQVELFQKTLNEYTQGDLDLALEIVKIATESGWVNCQWAINAYERNHPRNTAVKTTAQKVATKETIDTTIIF